MAALSRSGSPPDLEGHHHRFGQLGGLEVESEGPAQHALLRHRKIEEITQVAEPRKLEIVIDHPPGDGGVEIAGKRSVAVHRSAREGVILLKELPIELTPMVFLLDDREGEGAIPLAQGVLKSEAFPRDMQSLGTLVGQRHEQGKIFFANIVLRRFYPDDQQDEASFVLEVE